MAAFREDITEAQLGDAELNQVIPAEETPEELEPVDESAPVKRKKVANIKNPTIEAIAYELLRLPTEEAALTRLNLLKEFFMIARKQLEQLDKPSVLLWIRGYGLTPEDEAKGFVGHYAAVGIKQVRGGKFTLYPTKIMFELKDHPQRKTVITGKHPNWGHPVLRAVNRKKLFPSAQKAQDQLLRLHGDYSEVSIPGINKLFIMIYARDEEKKGTIQKYRLDVKPAEEGGFYIEATLNTGRKRPDEAAKVAAASQNASEIKAGTAILQGKLSSAVLEGGADKGVFTSVEILRKEEKMRKQAGRMKIRERFQQAKAEALAKEKAEAEALAAGTMKQYSVTDQPE